MMSGIFDNRTFAVTGAAGGIGQALCRFVAERGAALALLDKSPAVHDFARRLQQDGFTATSAVADIGSPEQVAEAFNAFGDIDVLVNNAGVSTYHIMAHTGPEGWRDDVNANLNGAYNCAHAVLTRMSERKTGNIVNIGSVNGTQALGDPAYSAAKAGLIALTKTIAMEYGRFGIRANIVMPGTVRTPIWDERSKKDPEVLRTLERWYPLGRIVEPVEIAKVIAFLASDDASAVTGAAIPVDCGLSAGNIVMTRELTVEDF